MDRLREEERWLVAESLTPTNIIDDVSVVERSVVKCVCCAVWCLSQFINCYCFMCCIGLGCVDCSEYFGGVGSLTNMFACLFKSLH